MKRIQPHVLGMFCLSISLFAIDGGYGPVFKETGFTANGGYLNAGLDISVNHYGGNLILSNTDVSIPSLGGFGLFFNRAYNSNQAFDPEEGQRISHDSPVGHGWNAHLGVLYVNNGYRPTLVSPSGGREIFYVHNRLTNQIPIVGSSNQTVYISASMSILVQPVSGNGWWLFRADGVTMIFEGNGIVEIPAYIFDLYANLWQVTYLQTDYEFNDGEYIYHPMISRIVDSFGRTLSFDYGQTLNGRKRLTGIRLNNQTLATYEYQSANGFTYLYRHRTGANRVTTYGTDSLGMITSITYPTGGLVQFAFAQKALSYFPGTVELVQALTSMTQKGVTQTLSYPSSSPVDSWPVTVSGSDGWTRTYAFHHYGNNPCAGNLFRIGMPSSVTETYNGQTRVQSFGYQPFQISNELLVSTCSAERPTIALRNSASESIDGQTLTTIYAYNSNNLNYPVSITSPGSHTELAWHHIAYVDEGGPWLRLGMPASTTTFAGASPISKTTWQYASSRAKAPSSIRAYTSSTAYEQTDFTWYNTVPRSGMPASRTYGGIVQESYQYSNGVLSGIDYAGSRPDMTRQIQTNGTVTSETVGGITSSFQWDSDFRLTNITRPANASTSIVYGTNTITVTQDGAISRETYDVWGRLIRSETDLQSGSAVVSSRTFDANDRMVSETLPSGLTYEHRYDVYGRTVFRDAIGIADNYVHGYATASNGETTMTTTRNGVVTTVLKMDNLGRNTFGSLGSHGASIQYTGNDAQVLPDGQPEREINMDYLGRKTGEHHPESGISSFGYNSFGALSTMTRPQGTFTQTYDADGRADLFKKGAQTLVDLDYHAAYGLVNKVTFEDTVLETPLYDIASRPTREKFKAPYFRPTVAPQYPNGSVQSTQLAADPRFRWTGVSGVSQFQFQLDDGHEVLNHQTTATTLSFANLGFLPGEGIAYSWRVRGLSTSGEPGAWSPWSTLSYVSPAGSCGADCSAARWHESLPSCQGTGYATVGNLVQMVNSLYLCPDGSPQPEATPATKNGGRR